MNFFEKAGTTLALAASLFAGAAANADALPGDEARFVPVGNQPGDCVAQYSRAVKQLAPAIVNTPVNVWGSQRLDASIAALSPGEQCSLKKDVERMLDSEANFALRALDKAVGLAQGNEQVRSHIERDVKDPDYLKIVYNYAKALSDLRTQMGVDKLRPESYVAERRAAEASIKALSEKKKDAVLGTLDRLSGNVPDRKPVLTGPALNV